MFFVYSLADPRTDVVAYVGMTNNLYQRFKQHVTLREANGKKNAWIRCLQKERVIPSVKVLDITETEEEAQEREWYWIRFYKDQGVELMNVHLHPRKKKNVISKPVVLGIDTYYTAAEAARYLNISLSTFHRNVQGNLVGYRPGARRGIYYRQSELDQYTRVKPLMLETTEG